MKNLINNFKYRLSFLFVLAVNALVFSQDWEDGGDPPPPTTHGDGSPASPIDGYIFSQFEGGDDLPPPPEGDGSPASPIDDYIIYLAIVGLFVIYYTYKKSNRLVKN